jgi:hypothetical protein
MLRFLTAGDSHGQALVVTAARSTPVHDHGPHAVEGGVLPPIHCSRSSSCVSSRLDQRAGNDQLSGCVIRSMRDGGNGTRHRELRLSIQEVVGLLEGR